MTVTKQQMDDYYNNPLRHIALVLHAAGVCHDRSVDDAGEFVSEVANDVLNAIKNGRIPQVTFVEKED